MPRDLVQPPVKPLDEVGILCHQAADLIEHFGHCKRDFQNHAGALCVFGALHLAISHGTSAVDYPGTQPCLAYTFANRLGFYGPGELTIWNDFFSRTKEEVIARLRACA